MSSKKGVQLNLETVVVAAALLFLLVIIFFITRNFFGDYAGGLANCEAKAPGAKCMSVCTEGTHFIGSCDKNKEEGCSNANTCVCCAPNEVP